MSEFAKMYVNDAEFFVFTTLMGFALLFCLIPIIGTYVKK
jgi:hypothetical protein